MKILYIGDLHLGSVTPERERTISERLIKRAEQADLVFVCGDLTDAGRPEQYARFIELYSPIKDKCMLIRGNHDMGDYMKTMQSRHLAS